MAAGPRALLEGYLDAKIRVCDAGYSGDVDWADGLAYVKPDAKYVLQEGAWVILNSGFRYAVARKLWPGISEAFNGWDPDLVDDGCVERALGTLNHPGKLSAMRELARIVKDEGVDGVVEDAQDPPKLCRLPWIGKITCWHLAKVLGADCVKPDVHLKRAAGAAGYATPLALCEAVREALGSPPERLTVIDSVLWRYGEQMRARKWPDWDELWRRVR